MKERYITQVISALKNNKLCDTGLLATQQVFFYESGPSGDKELLAFIFSDDEYSGYWYGHICRLSTAEIKYCSTLVWLKVFVNATTPELLLRRFYHATVKCLKYEPCTIQNIDDAISVNDTFEESVSCLSEMIKRFDIKKRFPGEDSEYYNDPVDIRILSLYGLNDPDAMNLIYPHFVHQEDFVEKVF